MRWYYSFVSVEISDASQQLTGGLSVGQNVSSVEIAAPIDTAGGDVAINSSQLTLSNNVPQVVVRKVMAAMFY